MSQCRAKDKGTCRVHGANHIAGKVYNDYVVKRGFIAEPEDVKEIVDQIILISDSYETDKDTLLTSKRDSYRIQKLYEMTYFYDKKSAYHRTSLPITSMIQQVVWQRDKDKTKMPEVNLLEAPTKDSAYSKYTSTLASYVAEEGTPVTPENSYYGWQDYDMKQHVGQCHIAAVESVHEDSWAEFNGTFNEDDDHVHGITAQAQCNCGFFKGELRVSGNVTDIIKDVVNRI